MVFILDEISGKSVSVTAEDETILTYCYDDSADRAYFHPVYAPNGQVVTAGAGTGQQHPPGVCFTFGTVKDENGEAVQMHRNVSAPASPPPMNGHVKFVSETTWNAPEPLLIETSTVTVHPRQPDMQIFDVSVALHVCAGPVAFSGDIGMGYHATEMEHRKTANASGQLGEAEVNGQLSDWGTLCGIAADMAIGVAILPHPANEETQFLAADLYFGFLLAHTAPFTLEARTTRTLAYRLLIYNGDLFTVDVADYYHDYLSTNTTN